jgi:hypothetical protein
LNVRLHRKLTGGSWLWRLSRWIVEDGGNIGAILALMIVPIVGAFAIGGETSSWFMYHRSQQNAADSAVLAAAIKNATGEGTTVATKYGYTTGVGHVTVSSTAGTGLCPAGASSLVPGATCYKVEVDQTVPLYLAKVVGYRDSALGGAGKLIKAAAVAGLTTGNNNFCMIGLNSIRLNGGPNTDLSGCQLLETSPTGNMTCSGTNSDNGLVDGFAVGTNGTNSSNTCGTNPVSGYTGDATIPSAATIASNLSSLSCTFAAASTFTGSLSTGNNCFSGNLKLTSNVTVTTPNTVLVVKSTPSAGGGHPPPNGGLDLNGHTISTSGTGSLTIVFTGTDALNASVINSSGGTIDIAAPNAVSGSAWKGVAIAEQAGMPNPTLSGQTKVLDMSFGGSAGSAITLKITGLIYLPNAAFNINGDINQATNGLTCIGIVALDISAGGTNHIFGTPTKDCRQAGLSLPTVPVVALLQ